MWSLLLSDEHEITKPNKCQCRESRSFQDFPIDNSSIEALADKNKSVFNKNAINSEWTSKIPAIFKHIDLKKLLHINPSTYYLNRIQVL